MRDLSEARRWAELAAAQEYKAASILLETIARAEGAPPPSVKPAKKADTAVADGGAEEVARLRALVQSLLMDLTGRVKKFEHDELDIVPRNGGYDIALPGARITTEDGSVFDIGTVHVHVEPASPEGDDVSVVVPGRIPFKDARGQSGAITIGEQSITLRWDRRFQGSNNFDVILGDVTVAVDAPVPHRVSIGELAAVAKMAEQEDGKWSGPVEFRVERLAMSTDQGKSLNLGRVAFAMNFSDFDLVAYRQAVPAEGGNAVLFSGDMAGLIGAFDAEVTLEALEAVDSAQGNLSLGVARYSISAKYLDQPVSDLVIRFGHEGLIGSGPMAPGEVIPDRLQLNILIDRLPVEAVTKVVATAGIEMALLGEIKSTNALMPELAAALTGAKSEMRIEKSEFSAPALAGEMSGSLNADEQSAFGVSGGLTVRLVGLTAFQKLLETRTGKAQGLREGVTMLLAMGKPESGGLSHRYDFQLRSDGTLLLNGDPFGMTPDATRKQ
jgi:hypothetical protein